MQTLFVLLGEHSLPGESRRTAALPAHAFPSSERWPDGQTALEHALSLDGRSAESWVKWFGLDELGAAEAIHELRRLARTLQKESLGHFALPAIALLAGARGHGEDCRRERWHTQLGLRTRSPWRPEFWRVAWCRLVLGVARAHGFSGTFPERLIQVHRAGLAWADQQARSPLLAALVLKASCTFSQAVAHFSAASPSDSPVPAGWAEMMKGGLVAGRLVQDLDRDPYVCPETFGAWPEACALVHEMLSPIWKSMAGPQWPSGLLEHPGFLSFAMPAAATGSFVWHASLEHALACGREWPRTPVFSRWAETLGDTPAVRSILAKRRAEEFSCSLQQTLPLPDGTSHLTRL